MMNNQEWQNFEFPEKPTQRLILVSNVSPVTDEKVIKDFFLFCGKIDQFLITPAEDNESNKVLILFEKDSAAKTALMLTNASIGDRNITVEPYYKEEFPTLTPNKMENRSQGQASSSSNATNNFNVPPFLNSIINSGVQLSQKVYQTGKDLDNQYGVSSQAKAYFERAREETLKLDAKYHVSERATELDKKLGVTSTLNTAAAKVTALSQQALETEQGKKVQGLYKTAVRSVEEIKDEALKALNIQPSPTSPKPTQSTETESSATLNSTSTSEPVPSNEASESQTKNTTTEIKPEKGA